MLLKKETPILLTIVNHYFFGLDEFEEITKTIIDLKDILSNEPRRYQIITRY